MIEDQRAEREALARFLRLEGYEVAAVGNVEDALALKAERFSLVLCDLRLRSQSGLDVLRAWQPRWPDVPFVMLTAFGEIESAVTATKLGAEDYLTKPLEPNALVELVRRAVGCHRSGASPDSADESQAFTRLVGHSEALLRILDQTRRAAKTDSLVLILGESGTGKELVAEAIHRSSRRRAGPYVVVNMAAVPEALVESELFGHVAGAFTGATQHRSGRFESADGGSLFIDEVGDFPITAQAKLLRALETLSVTPLGSDCPRQVDTRLIAATSRDLSAMVAAGEFRADLYYRLNVIALRLPALRERREDIPLLVDHFLQEFARAAGRRPLSIDDELRELLSAHSWPGNVRELRNLVERMVVMATGNTLGLADAPDELLSQEPQSGAAGQLPPGTLEDVQRSVILDTLARHNGNRTRAAAELGISVRTLQRKLKAWNVAEIGGA